MAMAKKYDVPVPMLCQRELDELDNLTARYEKMIKPGLISRTGQAIGEKIPQSLKKFTKELSSDLAEQKLYTQMMEFIGSGFKTLEEQAAKLSVSEKRVIEKVNSLSARKVETLNELCLFRSYDLQKLVSAYKTQDIFASALEGAATGAMGFVGIAPNLVAVTFLYFRAVQSIAMFYGYDVKNDGGELIIASEVFSSALSPERGGSSAVGKIMLVSKAAVVQQLSKKTWTDMAARGGIPLLIAQMRALAHKSAKTALEKAGKKGLENAVFRDTLEQIGRRLALKSITKAVPVVSALIGALIDTAQMHRVLDFADVFYQKRFLLEKERRIRALTGEIPADYEVEILDDGKSEEQ